MLHLPVPPEAAFDYLVEPRNRPAWQSSLTRVAEVDGGPRTGQTWVDVTVLGLRPRLETTRLDRPHSWSEHGTWRGFSAELTLEFAPAPGGCLVEASVAVRASGPGLVVAPLLRLLAPYAVRADLRRAARLLGRGPR